MSFFDVFLIIIIIIIIGRTNSHFSEVLQRKKEAVSPLIIGWSNYNNAIDYLSHIEDWEFEIGLGLETANNSLRHR